MMTLVRKQTLLGLLNVTVILILCWKISKRFGFTAVDRREKTTLVNHNEIINQNDTKRHIDIKLPRSCGFRVPKLHTRVQFTCGRGDFVSVVKSVCKTQLGNQLSSYAALLWFTVKHGYHAFLDPVQTRSIGMVFKKEKLSIGSFNYYACGCMPGAQEHG